MDICLKIELVLSTYFSFLICALKNALGGGGGLRMRIALGMVTQKNALAIKETGVKFQRFIFIINEMPIRIPLYPVSVECFIG